MLGIGISVWKAGAAGSGATPGVLVANRAQFTFTGQAATLKVGRLPLVAAQGSFTLSGQDATLVAPVDDLTLTAEHGSFALTGQAASLVAPSKVLAAAHGSFSLTGQAANTLTARRLVAAQGSFTLTGEVMTPVVDYPMSAAHGSFALTGQAATLTYTPVGGGSVDYIDEWADAQNIAFGSNSMTVSGITFTEDGHATVFVYNNARDITGVTILGNAATPHVESSDGFGGWWGADVTAGTGNIVITAGASLGLASACGGLVINANSTPTDTDVYGNNSTFTGDSQQNAVTIPSGGISISAVGGKAGGGATGNTGNPTTWSNATRVAAMEDSISTGDGVAVSGAVRTTAGAVTIGATGAGGNGWGFGGCITATVVFGP